MDERVQSEAASAGNEEHAGASGKSADKDGGNGERATAATKRGIGKIVGEERGDKKAWRLLYEKLTSLEIMVGHLREENEETAREIKQLKELREKDRLECIEQNNELGRLRNLIEVLSGEIMRGNECS